MANRIELSFAVNRLDLKDSTQIEKNKVAYAIEELLKGMNYYIIESVVWIEEEEVDHDRPMGEKVERSL